MPHITVTIVQGKCKDKKILANKIHDLVESELQTSGDNISVSFREVPKETWMSFIKTVPTNEMVVKPKYKIE
jgi:phenylpyruvate tautomerase PptA (4-oxalocrotonate tautomerase family)